METLDLLTVALRITGPVKCSAVVAIVGVYAKAWESGDPCAPNIYTSQDVHLYRCGS